MTSCTLLFKPAVVESFQFRCIRRWAINQRVQSTYIWRNTIQRRVMGVALRRLQPPCQNTMQTCLYEWQKRMHLDLQHGVASVISKMRFDTARCCQRKLTMPLVLAIVMYLVTAQIQHSSVRLALLHWKAIRDVRKVDSLLKQLADAKDQAKTSLRNSIGPILEHPEVLSSWRELEIISDALKKSELRVALLKLKVDWSQAEMHHHSLLWIGSLQSIGSLH